MDLVEEVYRIYREFPNHELYGLTNQIRRASVSIPSNIAEGAGRKSDKELLQFLNFALSSLAETETQIMIALRLGYTSDITRPLNLITEVRKLILGFRKFVKNKSNP